jgi:hypothetical protein
VAGGSTHYPASAPTSVITPSATYYAFFVGDGTGGTTLGTLYKKDSAATVTPVVPSTPGANSITNAMLAQAPALTVKGNNTGATANETDLTVAQLNAMGVGAQTGWIDVTLAATPYLTTNTAAQNITAMNAILAAAPAGSTIYIPGGTYQNNAAWTMPAKQFTFQGQGFSQTGGNTILQWTSNVGGDIITLATNTWYYQFNNLTFTTTVNQTAGAVININGNVSTNFYNVSTATAGGFFNHCLYGAAGGLNQSWNTANINNCTLSGYKGVGVYVDSAAASLVISNTVIQGAWGGFTGAAASLQATAGVQALNSGAVQLLGCDILGNINNVLLNPAVGQVNASFFCANTYFDNAAGSCFKIAGAGATVRVVFTGCSFTTAGTNYSTPGSGFSAIEITGSFAFTAGGQSISFTDCNIFNTFATAATTNGVLISGTWADVYFSGCKVAGWTNGFNVTPSGTNICNLKVTTGAVGPSGGYGANTTGFNIVGGSYKGLQIQQVNAHGNTTNLTLGAVTVAAADAALFRISDNTGINPRGAVTTPGFPASTVAVTNTTGFRVMVGIKGGTSSAVAVNGVAAVLAATPCSVFLDPGGTVAITFTVAPTWVWVAN